MIRILIAGGGYMKRKLNLTVDPKVLKRAREVSQVEGVSISRLFEKMIILYYQPETDKEKKDWLDQYYARNEKKLSRLDTDQIDNWLSKRGDKI